MEITAVPQVGHKRNRKGVAKNGETVNSVSVAESELEVHIFTERERRKKMRNMFSSLLALLPQLPSKADKSTIVDEAVKYIKTLQETLQKLEKQKAEKLQGVTVVKSTEPSTKEAFLAIQGPAKTLPISRNTHRSFLVSVSPSCFQTWFSPNVVMNMSGDDAQISVCSLKRPGLLTTIFYILEKHKLDVVFAHISSDQFRSIYMIHVRAGGGSGLYPEALSVEDTLKLAAGEMNLWILSC